MSEKTEAKARTYLTEGKVRVVSHDEDEAFFLVQGREEYEVRYKRDKGWWCNCPAYVPECAHLIAAKLVSHHGRPEPYAGDISFTPTENLWADPEIAKLLGD